MQRSYNLRGQISGMLSGSSQSECRASSVASDEVVYGEAEGKTVEEIEVRLVEKKGLAWLGWWSVRGIGFGAETLHTVSAA